MKKLAVVAVGLMISGLIGTAQNKLKPVISSNNFTTKTQLWESIGSGILNYQADVMFIYGKLFVTPLMPDSANHKLPTLTDAYLYPLYNQFKKNNGEIVPGYSGNVFLILNLTSQPVQIYKQLALEMRPFAEMLSFKIDGNEQKGKLRILIKDKLQLEKINSVKPGFLGLVGNMSDIDKNVDPEIMPLIEIDFNEITSWKGTGNIPFEDFTKIKNLVTKVHEQSKKISIINCPSYKTIADLVQTSKIDFVTTPEATRMAGFFEIAK
jgi:hypothetical protein